MENDNPNLTSADNNNDDFSLALTLKPIIKILLRFLKFIYIPGFIIIGITLILILLGLINIYLNLSMTNSNVYQFLNGVSNHLRNINFVTLGMLTISTYLYRIPLKKYYLSGSKTHLVNCLYKLMSVFIFLFYIMFFCIIKSYTK
jgi:hypothetical protein